MTERSSRLSGFYTLSVAERRRATLEFARVAEAMKVGLSS